MKAQPAAHALLRIYFNEDDHANKRGPPLAEVLLEHLQNAGIPGATIYRGVMGYGSHHQVHATSLLRLTEHLPLMLEAVHEELPLRHLVEELHPLLQECLVLIQPVEILHQPHGEDKVQ
ncbi:DUF190 domain-containing protein [Magnetococcus sp. PR-3]|uniref:DUF190 domain-containing protein n=1 Tax=Magnetococcus sp. PR-3 TaxID=3120355 RepID=UPI002FCE0D6F